MRSKYFILPLSIIAILITSCGFHLRGSQPDSKSELSSVYIIDSDASTVGNAVRNQLSLSGTRVTSAPDEADYTLHLFNQSVSQSVLSVSADTGKVEEYQLQLSVMMTVSDINKNERIANQQIRINGNYAFDNLAVLGSENERQLLVSDMTKQAASQVIRRLNSLGR